MDNGFSFSKNSTHFFKEFSYGISVGGNFDFRIATKSLFYLHFSFLPLFLKFQELEIKSLILSIMKKNIIMVKAA